MMVDRQNTSAALERDAASEAKPAHAADGAGRIQKRGRRVGGGTFNGRQLAGDGGEYRLSASSGSN